MRRWRLVLPFVLLPVGLAGTAGQADPAPVRLVDVPCPAVTSPASAPPFASGACTGVRPGAAIHLETRLCTLGFLFKGSDGRKYAATAGHCVSEQQGEKTWAGTTGLAVKDGTGKQIGTVAYWIYRDSSANSRKDFALIRLADGLATNAELCTFGGPTGMNTAIDDDYRQIHHVGQGQGVSAVFSARTGLIRGLPNPDYFFAYALASGGDSGAPVTDTSGKVLGLVTQQVAGPGGTIGINRVGPHADRARKELRLRSLSLLTGQLR